MCSLLWLSLAISLVVASAGSAVESPQDFLEAKRQLEEDNRKQPREVSADLEEAEKTFFKRDAQGPRLGVGEMGSRVVRQLNEDLISSSRDFGNGEQTPRDRESSRPMNVNVAVDSLLATMRSKLPATFILGDIDKPFRKKILFVHVSGVMHATNCMAEDLRTMERTSDVFLSVTPGGISLAGSIGLQTLHIGCDYKLTTLGVKPEGRLEGTVGYNSARFVLNVAHASDGNCSEHFEEVKVERLDDIEIQVTGLSVFNRLVSSLATSMVNSAKGNLENPMQTTIIDMLVSVVKEVNLCEVFL